MIAIQQQSCPGMDPPRRVRRERGAGKIVTLKPMPEPKSQVSPVDQSHMLRAVASRDREAFASLFEFFAPRIKSMMMRNGMTAAQAEDLAQDTMLTVWRKASLYEAAAGTPAAWIYTIARNRRIDLARSAQRAPPQDVADHPEPEDDQPLPDAALQTAETEQRVREALKHLSSEQQNVIVLSFFENRSHSEIAEHLGIPLGTVKSRIRLAFQRLRDLLGDLQ